MFPRQSQYVTLWGNETINLDYDNTRWQIHRKVNKYLLTFVICVILASIGSEFLQYLVTKGVRNFDPLDMMVNIMGSSLGLGIFYYVENKT